MTPIEELPLWAEILVSLFLLLGSGVTLIGCTGLVRFKTFYERIHAPTLGSTLGTFAILTASMLYFSITEARFVLHELLIGAFVTITTPVTFLLLVQATVYRDRFEGTDPLAGLGPEQPTVKTPPEPS
jgi:multicomponent K+:H+ antiporter subunit G